MANKFIARFEDEPVLSHPDQHRRFTANLMALDAHMSGDMQRELALDGDDFWFPDGDWRAMFRPYNVVNGILMVPIKGVLLHDFGYQIFDYATGYVYIEKAIERGIGDGNVKGIALVINSPGGEVAGNFPLVDKIFGWRGEKPIRAYAAESAYSAAYSIASAADSITVSRTGGVGSIGVVTSHVDVSKMMEEYGWKITFIHAGKHKVDGNPYEALKPEVKERIQARIDDLYGIFVSTVARNRDMEESAVRATEALTYSAPDALSIGLADEIGNLNDSIAAFAVELALEDGDETMAGVNKDGTTSEVDVEKEKAEAFAAGKDAGKAEGVKEGGAAMQARISAIFELPEAAARPAAAHMLAFDTDKSPEDCAKSLAKLPEEKATAPVVDDKKEKKPNATADGFVKVMGSAPNPDIGEPGEEDAEASEKERRYEAAVLAAMPSHNKKKVA